MNFFQIASFGINENFFMGIFHGILFSMPLSIPFLISLRYFLLKGLSFGFTSLFGILCGQLVFFVILCSGLRPLILLWYSMEPILAFTGLGITFHLATDFYHQKKFVDNMMQSSLDSPKQISLRSQPFSTELKDIDGFFRQLHNLPLEKIKIFLLQFCLIFLNPVFPALSTRMILSQDILTHFSLFYTSGFFIGSILCVGSFLLFLKSIYFLFTSQQLRFPSFITQVLPFKTQTSKGLTGPTGSSSIESVFFSVDTFSKFVNNCFVFCILGLSLYGSFQYTWRFITHYPFEFLVIPGKNANQGLSMTNTSPDSSEKALINQSSASPSSMGQDTPIFKEILREFPAQDSNIRHREKTLPVERHLPLERINLRRTLSGRPPLNEEQKSDASIKYNSFFLNKIEEIFENWKIRLRENTRVADNSYQTVYNGLVLSLIGNKAKGKPQFSYIRPLVSPSLVGNSVSGAYIGQSKAEVSSSAITFNPYIHDDLSVYYALFKVQNLEI